MATKRCIRGMLVAFMLLITVPQFTQPLRDQVHAASLDPTTTTLTAMPLGSATSGTTVTFAAHVAGQTSYTGTTGAVTFQFTGATITTSAAIPLSCNALPSCDGDASYQISTLNAGVTHVVAHYSDNSTPPTFASSDSDTQDYTITGGGTTASATSLVAASGGNSSASMLSVTMGDNVTFTATLTATSGTPTGNVQFTDGMTPLGPSTPSTGGTATLSTTTLTAGSHTITAVYGGDATYAGSNSNTVTVMVSGSTATTPTTLALTASANPTPSSPFTLTATVSAGGSPVTTGSVAFTEGTTPLTTISVDGNGTAVYTSTGAFSSGSHTVTATYGGTSVYQMSTNTVMFTVASAATSTGAASPSSIASGFGLSLVVNVPATGPTITGVTVDLTAIGLGVTPLTGVSGATTWHKAITVPASAPVGGPYALPVTLTDSTSATASGTPLSVAIIRSVRSVSITPNTATVIAGSTTPFSVLATYTNGTTETITTGATWRVGSTQVATVDASGRVKAGSAGSTLLTATYGEQSAQLTLTVVAGNIAPPPPPPAHVGVPNAAPAPHPTAAVPSPHNSNNPTPNPVPTRH